MEMVGESIAREDLLVTVADLQDQLAYWRERCTRGREGGQ